MTKEFVDGSSISFDRNPHYWDTTTINGVEYEIPFADELIFPVIVDESMRIAALRTGKLDVLCQVPMKYEDTLAATSPELLKNKYARDGVSFLVLMPDREPFIKKEVRQALMIAIDRQAIVNAVYSEGETHAWPVSPTLADVYTPFDQLPASTQELLTYDPDSAKKMLIDAGYPEGFEIELIYNTAAPYDIDIASMTEYYWDEIGVTATVSPLESVAYYARCGEWDFDVAVGGFTSGSPIDVFSEFLPTFPGILLDQYDNPYFVERYWEASEMADAAARDAIWKELSIILLDDAPVIPIGMDYKFSMWWPWLKNYYGETCDCNLGIGNLMGTAWIDQDLKAELGH
ncbi:Heme-binding protein A [subsurface metagenome]